MLWQRQEAEAVMNKGCNEITLYDHQHIYTDKGRRHRNADLLFAIIEMFLLMMDVFPRLYIKNICTALIEEFIRTFKNLKEEFEIGCLFVSLLWLI